MKKIELTPSQQKGYDKFMEFYCNPMETVMLLKGYSGTGKSTLIRTLIDNLPEMAEMCRMIAPEWKEPEILLTATTNQAANALYISTGQVIECTTIHSALKLILMTVCYRTGKKELVPVGDPVENKLIFIDEASFSDYELLNKIFQQTVNCKIVFVGDHAQLTPVGLDVMPAFELNNNEIELTDLVRFDAGPMTELVTSLRRAVLEQKWSKFPIVPGVIEKLSQTEFENAALLAFSDPKAGHVKVLAYTNDQVTRYNNLLAKKLLGTHHPQPGMFMMVNAAVRNNASSCFTNEEVQLATVEEAAEYNVQGWEVTFVGKSGYYFMPKHRKSKDAAHRMAVEEDDYQAMKIILDTWIDLRPSFACTVNKSQGSTYDTVFIDLNDICGKINNLNQLARQLYVATSRARSRVYFTGDLRRS